MKFDIENHRIIFKHAYLTTIIDMDHVYRMTLDDMVSPVNHQRLRRWVFDVKSQDKCGKQFIPDNFIAQSQQKNEIRNAFIAICKMHCVPVVLQIEDTKYFE